MQGCQLLKLCDESSRQAVAAGRRVLLQSPVRANSPALGPRFLGPQAKDRPASRGVPVVANSLGRRHGGRNGDQTRAARPLGVPHDLAYGSRLSSDSGGRPGAAIDVRTTSRAGGENALAARRPALNLVTRVSYPSSASSSLAARSWDRARGPLARTSAHSSSPQSRRRPPSPPGCDLLERGRHRSPLFVVWRGLFRLR